LQIKRNGRVAISITEEYSGRTLKFTFLFEEFLSLYITSVDPSGRLLAGIVVSITADGTGVRLL
jgi:hypothetical protein